MQENQIAEQTTFEKKQKKVLFKTYTIVWYICSVIETLLAFRFALKLFAANPSSSFTTFIYSLTRPFVQPFLGIFRTPSEGGFVMETATLVAMAVYMIIAYVVAEFLKVVKPVSADEADREMNA